MHLSNQQWNVVQSHIPQPARKFGRPRRNDRDILDGILWILRTGAPWKDLPGRYPPYQTCHRRFQEWTRRGVFTRIISTLAQDLEERGGIKLEECFIDGTFASAKKGELVWGRPNVEKAVKSWQLQTKRVFQSPSLWDLLLHMKSPWLQKRLSEDLRTHIQYTLSEIKHMTVIR